METSSGVVTRLRRSLSGFIVITVMLGTLAACGSSGGGSPTTAPAATTLPAATVAATKASSSTTASATASPARGAASPAAGMATPMASPAAAMASPVAAMATPVAAMATPVSMAASAEATPVKQHRAGRATPVSGEGGATPVGGEGNGAQCKDYATWWNDPDVKSALELTKLWPEVIAEGEKAAAGQPVDTELMRKDYEQMSKVATALRNMDVAPVNRDTAKNLAQAMGAVSRMAGALADNKLDKDAAAAAVKDAQQSIDAYNAEVAAQKDRCS